MDSISPSQLNNAINFLKKSGKEIRPLKDRVGFYVVEGYVKHAEGIVQEASGH
jgi:hypothetical protein